MLSALGPTGRTSAGCDLDLFEVEQSEQSGWSGDSAPWPGTLAVTT